MGKIIPVSTSEYRLPVHADFSPYGLERILMNSEKQARRPRE